MIVQIDEAILRQWVAEGLSDEEIAERIDVRPYLVTQARRAAGVKRAPGRQGQERESFLLRLPAGQLVALHAAAHSAGHETTGDWLARLALEAPELARAVRTQGTRKTGGRTALAALLVLLLGPEDQPPDASPDE